MNLNQHQSKARRAQGASGKGKRLGVPKVHSGAPAASPTVLPYRHSLESFVACPRAIFLRKPQPKVRGGIEGAGNPQNLLRREIQKSRGGECEAKGAWGLGQISEGASRARKEGGIRRSSILTVFRVRLHIIEIPERMTDSRSGNSATGDRLPPSAEGWS